MDIAACELAVESIETAQFMTTGGEGIDEIAAAITATLDRTDATVRALL